MFVVIGNSGCPRIAHFQAAVARCGLSLLDIKEIFDVYNADPENRLQNGLALRKFKNKIVMLEQQRKDIDEAIDVLRQSIERMEAAGFSPANPPPKAARGSKRLEETH